MRDARDPLTPPDFRKFLAARDRFFARVRPEAMARPPASPCPDAPPRAWVEGGGGDGAGAEGRRAG